LIFSSIQQLFSEMVLVCDYAIYNSVILFLLFQIKSLRILDNLFYDLVCLSHLVN
jgi:hypothetical protein